MKFLLDTHTFIWRLATKYRIRKLSGAGLIMHNTSDRIAEQGFKQMSIAVDDGPMAVSARQSIATFLREC